MTALSNTITPVSLSAGTSTEGGLTLTIEGSLDSKTTGKIWREAILIIERAAPRTVLEMEFFLLQDLSTRSKIIFRKEYAEQVPLKEGSPESLVQGWNDGLRQILTALENDLKGIDFTTKSSDTPPL